MGFASIISHQMAVLVVAAASAVAAEAAPFPACLEAGPGAYALPSGDIVAITASAKPSGLRWTHEDGRTGLLQPDGAGGVVATRGWTEDADAVQVDLRDCRGAGIGFDGVDARRVALRVEEASIEVEGARLAGRLVMPVESAEASPVPLVVEVQGSGRGSHIDSNHRQYLLPARGIAVFVYDKRGTGRSSGAYTQDFHVLARDAAAAFTHAASRVGGDARRGFFGSSQGGWVAPLAALEVPADFVVVSHGLAYGALQEDREQVLLGMRAAGWTEPLTLEKAAEVADAAARVITRKGEEDVRRMQALRDAYREEPWWAARTGLSRTTVVAAYQRLQAEGLLQARVGDGSYVSAPAVASQDTMPPAAPCPPQSAFARRARAALDSRPVEGERSGGHRYSFRYDALQISSTLADDWARLLARVAPYVKAGYPPIQGSARLRAGIAMHVRVSRGIDCHADDVLVVNGARQAYSLATRVLLDAGDRAAIEDPHYFGIRRVLEAEAVDVCGIPVDDDGMRVEALDGRGAKAVFVMPSHQFPIGSVLSRGRRSALLEYARRSDAWIVEDDFGAEFRHGEHAVRALYDMDGGERVVHIGSFSRTLSPAIRLGYLLMPRALREDFIAAKSLSDFGVSPYEQEALAELIASGACARHIRLCAATLAERRGRLRQALEGARFACMHVGGRNAGMHLVGWLDGIDGTGMHRLMAAAAERGLSVESMAPFHLRPPRRQALMLGMGCLHTRDIPAAAAVLADCLEDCGRPD